LRRYLEFQAYEVQHIQNITDVDDDMVRVSRERGLSIAALTEENHAIHLREMDSLHVLRPNAFPRASEYIEAIVAMVRELVASGHAYEVEGHVFFSAASAEHFGELAGCTPAELRDAPRTDSMPEEPEHLKRDPLDFLLWQPGTDPGATFESPWGLGRPGWHVECSAMARATLGEQIDIHGGGADLAYPHHESEIAQSEAATGRRPFAGTWMHVGTMKLDGAKMSKSLGNLVKVSELLERGHSADAVRLALLSRRYREDHDFDEGALAGGRAARPAVAQRLHGGDGRRLRHAARDQRAGGDRAGRAGRSPPRRDGGADVARAGRRAGPGARRRLPEVAAAPPPL
jgi:L-cysteine:1D-myo-inositol 2-amino-2-deoxy-alpha-D-glucopyranoside ligase